LRFGVVLVRVRVRVLAQLWVRVLVPVLVRVPVLVALGPRQLSPGNPPW
jgi:hypothetical protein